MSIYGIVALALVLFVAGVAIGWAGQRLLSQVISLRKQLDRLEEDVKGQKENQEQLEERRKNQEAELQALRDRRRLPHCTAEGLEDSIAIVLDLLQEEEAYRAYRDTRLAQLHERLKEVRKEPVNYREQANTKRLYSERKKG